MTKDKLGIILALVAATSMGTIAIFAKMAYSFGATPLTVLVIRFGVASLLLWAYLYWQQEIERVEGKKLIALGVLGIIYGLSSLCYFTSLELTSASIATLLLYTAPVFVVIISVLIGDEKITVHKIISVVTASLGLYLVLDLSVDTFNLTGILFGIGSGLFYCLFVVGNRRYAAGINSLLATACTVPATFLFHLSVSIASNQLSVAQPPAVWFYGILIAFFGTAVGIGCLTKSIQLIGASKSSIICTIEPAVTIALAAIIFQERMTLPQFIGGVFIIGAILIVNIDQARADSNELCPERANRQ
ncbi:MAG: EamA family transporter [Clostridia bacterium]|nr:EamA family transporter [Clostridia bacterium]